MCACCTVEDHTGISSDAVWRSKRTVIDGGGISFIIVNVALLNTYGWRSHRSVLLESSYRPIHEIHVAAAAIPPPPSLDLAGRRTRVVDASLAPRRFLSAGAAPQHGRRCSGSGEAAVASCSRGRGRLAGEIQVDRQRSWWMAQAAWASPL